MKTVVVATLLATLGVAGCSKKTEPPPPEPRPAAAAVSVDATPEAAAPPAPTPNEPPPTGAPASAPEHELSLKELTTAVQTYMQVNPEYPKDLNDLVKMKLLKKMPVPPPGKKFVIDRQNICVILADK
jgi:hypothetical protein